MCACRFLQLDRPNELDNLPHDQRTHPDGLRLRRRIYEAAGKWDYLSILARGFYEAAPGEEFLRPWRLRFHALFLLILFLHWNLQLIRWRLENPAFGSSVINHEPLLRLMIHIPSPQILVLYRKIPFVDTPMLHMSIAESHI